MMEKFKLLNELSESKMFRTSGRAKIYSLRDVADLTFLYLIGLTLLRDEFGFISSASDYLHSTTKFNNFKMYRVSGNDLYNLLYLLFYGFKELKSQKGDEDLSKKISIDEDDIRYYLKRLERGQISQQLKKRYLMQYERQLSITDSNYRSMRRIIASWDTATDHQKKVAITRFLFAVRHRARLSELRDMIEQYATEYELELTTVTKDPESGSDVEKKTFSKSAKNTAIFGALAVGAAAYGLHRGGSKAKAKATSAYGKKH